LKETWTNESMFEGNVNLKLGKKTWGQNPKFVQTETSSLTSLSLKKCHIENDLLLVFQKRRLHLDTNSKCQKGQKTGQKTVLGKKATHPISGSFSAIRLGEGALEHPESRTTRKQVKAKSYGARRSGFSCAGGSCRGACSSCAPSRQCARPSSRARTACHVPVAIAGSRVLAHQ
jgi:hypothetical protein